VRTCCQDKGICQKCWSFIVIAVKILQRTLREDFGFKNCLWVFSGRRGVHCWIADDRARKMDLSARKAFISYLEIIKGGAEQKKKVHLGHADVLHPMVSKSLAVVEPIFSKKILFEQDILSSEDRIKKLLSLIHDDVLKDWLYKDWASQRKLSPKEKWDQLAAQLDQNTASSKKGSNKAAGSSKYLKNEIMLQYCYPRLDANVSIQLNHLLKSPFCVHPATEKICVPFRPDEVDSFDPDRVCKVRDILKEVYGDIYSGDLTSTSIDYSRTSLAGPIKIFDAFLQDLHQEQQRILAAQREDEDSKMAY
jgi:DNA primase small subunit